MKYLNFIIIISTFYLIPVWTFLENHPESCHETQIVIVCPAGKKNNKKPKNIYV